MQETANSFDIARIAVDFEILDRRRKMKIVESLRYIAGAAFVAVFVAVASFVPQKGFAGELDYGKVGEPIHLVVAHPCCFAEVWSVYALRHLESYKKYLPKGSTVEFTTGLQGAIVVNAMLAGKAHIGYMGDLVAYTSSTKQQVADLRMVAAVGQGYDQCNVFLVRKDAPQFKSPDEAIRWMHGKQVATPKGSCTDMLIQHVFDKNNVKPAAYLNQSLEIISSGFKSGKLDAAAIWEPNASSMETDGIARRVASGESFGQYGVSYMMMRNDLIKQRPDVVKAWLNAELDGELFIADPRNANEIVNAVKKHVTGFTERALWMSIYGGYPDNVGGTKVRLTLPFGFTAETQAHLEKGTAFLFANKAINIDKLRPDAVVPEFAAQILKERGLKAPVGSIKSQSLSSAPK